MSRHRLFFDVAERVAWTAAQAFLAAVVVLPGGVWASTNWKVAAGAALIALVKGFAASRLTGDPGTAATLPASVTATGAVVGEVTGTVVSEAGEVVGEVTGTVGGVVDDLLDGHPEGGGLDTVEDDSRIDERGGLGLFILLGVAALVVFGFAIDACFADSSERNDVGMARTEDNEPCSGKGACEGNQGDCRNTESGGYCEDNDASPSFQDSPVDHSFNPVICLPGATCNIEGGQGGDPQRA